MCEQPYSVVVFGATLGIDDFGATLGIDAANSLWLSFFLTDVYFREQI